MNDSAARLLIVAGTGYVVRSTRCDRSGAAERSCRADRGCVGSWVLRTAYSYLVPVPGTLEPVINGCRASTRGFVTVPVPMYEVPVPCTASRRARSRRSKLRVRAESGVPGNGTQYIGTGTAGNPRVLARETRCVGYCVPGTSTRYKYASTRYHTRLP